MVTVDNNLAPEVVPAALRVPDLPAENVPVARREVKDDWDNFLEFVDSRKKWIAQALKRNSGVMEENGLLIIKFDEITDCLLLQDAEHLKSVAELAQEFFHRPMKIRYDVKEANQAESEYYSSDNLLEDRRALANDSLVQMATEVFGGQVVAIRPGSRRGIS
ncbi:MAG: hypothetical protein A2511_08040 [Deltaproteobacteria bacterium RIFOXYD12_FULL_50_9]|nr:MAG: hypothetical protein A2511_08040 [Deltaproteobacteria bacterium RIFOXYD12_FULL_50_9]